MRSDVKKNSTPSPRKRRKNHLIRNFLRNRGVRVLIRAFSYLIIKIKVKNITCLWKCLRVKSRHKSELLIRHFWFPLTLVRLQFFDAQHLVIEPLPVAKMGSDLRHVRNQKKSRTFFKNTFIRKEINKCLLLLEEIIQKVTLT